MKNYYFVAAMVGLLFIGCSVDNDEMRLTNDQIQTANSVIEIDGCTSMSYDLYSESHNLGEFTITNDTENLYLNFSSKDGFLIYDIRWEVMNQEADLPINSNGINSSQLEGREKFNAGTSSHGKTINLTDFGEKPGSLIVTAEIILKNSKNNRFISWVGDIDAGKNESKYLKYTICEFMSALPCTINAGSDKSVTYTREYVESRVSSSHDVEPLFYELLDEDATKGGTINPGVGVFLPSYEKNPYQTFTTKYTVTDGNCTDFAILSITVVERIESGDPICTISAGGDKSVTYTREYVESRVSSSHDVEPLFYELLDEDATKGGTINPGVGVILPSYEKNPYQTFTTKYTVTDGDCTDFAILSITVTQ